MKLRGRLVLLTVSLCYVFLLQISAAPQASAAINPQINFQGKLTNTDGTNITDGTYSIVFGLYSVSAGGTAIWSETQSSISVVAGNFQVALGSITSLPGSVDFNSSSIYLGIKVGSDAEMTPRIQFTAAPYAFNADKLGGLNSASFVQLSPGTQQTGFINVSGNIGAGGTYNTNTFTSSNLQFGAASAATIQAASGQNISVDSGTSGSVSVGATNASGVTVGKVGTVVSAPGGLLVNSGATVPVSDQVAVDNTSSAGVTTAGVNGLSVKYRGGAAAVEASGMRVDFIPGTTSGGTWSGMRVVAGATGAASGVNAYGIKLEGPTAPGIGQENAVEVGTGWDIGIDIQSGGMQLAAQADPAAPAANNLRMYAQDIAGRVMPKWLGPTGASSPVQASLGFNRVAMAIANTTANCSTGYTLLGTTLATAGTCTAPALASTNLMSSVRRIVYPTTTTAGSIVYQRQASNLVWRGNAAGLGGFFYTTRFGTSTTQAGNRAFIGLADTVANPTNIDPIASSTYGKLGVAINLNTGNWKFINNVVGTVPTATDLGANFTVNTTSLYELIMFSAPNGTSIGYKVTNLSTGTQTSGSFSTNIPSNTTFVNPVAWITNNATNAAASLDYTGWYLESDY